MAQTAASSGFEISSPREAEFLVINTCTVTSRTDRQIRQIIRQATRQAPEAKLIITGCYAQRSPEEFTKLPQVRAVLGNPEKAFWPELLPVLTNNGEPLVRVANLAGCRHFTPMPLQYFHGQTRAFIKIQDGCNNFCSYCIVPLVRGPERSLPIPEILKQIRVLIAGGFKEIVLTGINLSRFGQDLPGEQNLLTLIRQLKQTDWAARFRLSSLEPQDLTWEVLQELSAWPQFCHHFHVPMQSGAAAVLKAMGRNYQPEQFENLIRQIKLLFPKAAIGMDVMVGFPTESPADFRQTRELLDRLAVSYLHVFPFSARPGTPAADLQPVAESKEIHRRARELRALGSQKKLSFMEQSGKSGSRSSGGRGSGRKIRLGNGIDRKLPESRVRRSQGFGQSNDRGQAEKNIRPGSYRRNNRLRPGQVREKIVKFRLGHGDSEPERIDGR